jgi:hypothetical protein
MIKRSVILIASLLSGTYMFMTIATPVVRSVTGG